MSFREQLQRVLIKADVSLDTLAELMGRDNSEIAHWLTMMLPFQISLLNDLAEICNHEVVIKLKPLRPNNVKVVELLELADSNFWKEKQNIFGDYDILNDEGRVMMTITDTPKGLEIFITPYSEKVLMEKLGRPLKED